MGKGPDNIFRPVTFEFGQVHIAGGFTTKPATAKSKTIERSDRKHHMFVEMVANEHWLLTATCGSGDKNRSAFSRTSLLTILREHTMRLADGIEAIDTTPVARDEDYDPMRRFAVPRLQQGRRVYRPTYGEAYVTKGTVLRIASPR